ncbi:uncharacterized protein STEHIDRAFT_22047, partial [Stereum hirsutum FP-91666 SS1]|uniref:uncharacterized protein n=1 Tax=Stereum hirsutum (strain FP-91666) TaxID=721885 RepID=UPI000440A2E3
NNLYAPYKSKLDWEFANWAKSQGCGSTAVTELLSMEGVHEKLGLSYKSARDLNNIIDKQLPPRRPRFFREDVTVDGQSSEFYHRSAMDGIRALYGDPEYASELLTEPVRLFTDDTMETRIYNQMNTGDWWWKAQVSLMIPSLPPSATVVPLIFSSDTTQLTLFRNKAAYPIYLTLGNIPKEIRRKPSRRAYILVGYLPASKLSHIKNKNVRRQALNNLFHACVRKILAPTQAAARNGIDLTSGDGVTRRCYPIFAVFIGDYPEQLLVTCCKKGQCPKCAVPSDELGENQTYAARNLPDVLDALSTIDRGPDEFVAACSDVGIKPVPHPFWENLAYSNPFVAISPDILHEILQGLIRDLVKWLRRIFGEDEIDARFRRMSPNHSLRFFKNGVSNLSKISGQEHKDICRVILGVIVGLPLPGGRSPARLVRSVRALLDFLYLAQYPSHTSDTLDEQKRALDKFHANKAIFEELGIRTHWKIPKLHKLSHYVPSTSLFGTADNFDTQYTERLHIDVAKNAYNASNRRDEFPQMTLWLERREKMMEHERFIQWRIARSQQRQDAIPLVSVQPPQIPRPLLPHVARYPNAKAVSFQALATYYGATQFESALARFIVELNNPSLTPQQISHRAKSQHVRCSGVPVFHRVKFWHRDPQGFDDEAEILDTIHARPLYRDTQHRKVEGRFDTALVDEAGEGEESGVAGYRVAQVRVIFTLPKKMVKATFRPGTHPPAHLAYIEWFSRFPDHTDPNHDMYRLTRTIRNGQRHAVIMPIDQLKSSVHLYPSFGPTVPRDWTPSNVLDKSHFFFSNPFSNRRMYITLY